MDDRPAIRIACSQKHVKRKLGTFHAEVIACLGGFPPAMMFPHESHRNARPPARRWILLRIEPLCHRSHAWASPALRRAPSAARIPDSFSSLGARNCADTLSD